MGIYSHCLEYAHVPFYTELNIIKSLLKWNIHLSTLIYTSIKSLPYINHPFAYRYGTTRFPSHTQPSCSKLTGLCQILKLHTLTEKKHVHESLRHGVTTHNLFAHYPWDIYGGFGHNGMSIQCILPSHTQPSRSILTVWASFRNFTYFGKETCAWKSQTPCYRPWLVCALPLGLTDSMS